MLELSPLPGGRCLWDQSSASAGPAVALPGVQEDQLLNLKPSRQAFEVNDLQTQLRVVRAKLTRTSRERKRYAEALEAISRGEAADPAAYAAQVLAANQDGRGK